MNIVLRGQARDPPGLVASDFKLAFQSLAHLVLVLVLSHEVLEALVARAVRTLGIEKDRPAGGESRRSGRRLEDGRPGTLPSGFFIMTGAKPHAGVGTGIALE